MVDDHALFRRGLVVVIGGEPDLEVVGEAADGVEAVDKAVESSPDVVVMDLEMPVLDGIEATRRIMEALPATRVLMLAAGSDERSLFAAVRAGVAGYLLKELAVEEVPAAVRATARGHGLVAPSLAGGLLREFARVSAGTPAPDTSPDGARLTERELEVLAAVARGRTNREIAVELEITENTVKNHVASVLDKLRLSSRTEAATYAIQERIVHLDR